MPTKKHSEEAQGTTPGQSMDLRELTELLIRHYGFRKGYFDLLVQFQIGTGAVGPMREEAVPGVMVGLAGVGLKQVDKLGPKTLDAAIVNPLPKPRKRKKSSSNS